MSKVSYELEDWLIKIGAKMSRYKFYHIVILNIVKISCFIVGHARVGLFEGPETAYPERAVVCLFHYSPHHKYVKGRGGTASCKLGRDRSLLWVLVSPPCRLISS